MVWQNLDTVGRPSAGGSLLTAWGDAVDDDMNLLAQSIQLLGIGGAVAGSPPSVATPVYKLQAGYISVTTGAGGTANITFPAVFPTGVVFALTEIFFNAGVTNWDAKVQAFNTSLITFNLWNMSTNATVANQPINVMWAALGF